MSKVKINFFKLIFLYEYFIFRGHLPTAEQILYSSDLIELKKCIYASQVMDLFFILLIYFSSSSSVHHYHQYVHIMYVMMQRIQY
jgi:hypothetical protein